LFPSDWTATEFEVSSSCRRCLLLHHDEFFSCFRPALAPKDQLPKSAILAHLDFPQFFSPPTGFERFCTSLFSSVSPPFSPFSPRFQVPTAGTGFLSFILPFFFRVHFVKAPNTANGRRSNPVFGKVTLLHLSVFHLGFSSPLFALSLFSFLQLRCSSLNSLTLRFIVNNQSALFSIAPSQQTSSFLPQGSSKILALGPMSSPLP